MKMISTFLTAAAFYQTAAVRPERAGAGSAALARVGDLLEPARVLASSMNTLETSQAIKAASGIVDKILLQQGNATKHMEAEDKTLLQQVVDLMTTTVYGSMDSSHTADEGSLSASIADIEKCNTDIANRQSATGDLGRMHRGVKNKQEELNSLQLVVDAKTAANNSAWEVLAIHMSLIANPPAVPAFPARTMGALNVYFERSDYCLWFGAQQAAFIEKRDIWVAANKALEDAIAAYNIAKAKRDVQFCDWKTELEESCAAFEECYSTKSEFYTKELKPRVTTDMTSRIENFKAGETLIQQIKFLLAESGTRETPTVKTSRYEIDFPSVPAQGTCDLSPLTSSEWVPTVNCKGSVPWKLAMNIHPSDGHNFGWGAEWDEGTNVGTEANAFSKDYLDSAVWRTKVGSIAIARHQNSACEAVKVWKLKDSSKSMLQYFDLGQTKRQIITEGGPHHQHITAGMAGQAKDVIFGVDGDLAVNWQYSNNGARIVLTGTHLSKHNVNDDDTHGLGNEFGARTDLGRGSSSWWHDVSIIQGNCHGGTCGVQGNDHGHRMHNGPVYGQYAIYVTEETDTESFPCSANTKLSRHFEG